MIVAGPGFRAEHLGDHVVQVQEPCVSVLLRAEIPEIGFDAGHAAGVVYSGQERSAVGVEERGDGLGDRGLKLFLHLLSAWSRVFTPASICAFRSPGAARAGGGVRT
jgi:hypothetical protein